jgi:ABC-type proline/glycine betaine transport system permease subunit
MQALAKANQRAGKLRSAATVAFFNGTCLAVFSILAFLWLVAAAAFGEFDWVALVMGAGLGILARNEYRGRGLLRQFDPRAPRLLGFNQLALLGLIVAYAAWMMAVSAFGSGPYDEEIRQHPRLAEMLGNIGDLHKTLSLVVYGTVIAVTVVFQGLNALYYFTRAKVLRSYIEKTPDWVVDLQRCQAGGLPTSAASEKQT